MSQEQSPSGVSAGAAIFAGSMMVMVGLFQMLAGIAAILSDTLLKSSDGYFLKLDPSAWGWAHLLIGLILGLAGFGVFMGATWARVIGIILAILSAAANFLFIPVYPVWAVVVIAVDVTIIYGLATYHPAPLED
jgi:hypothetical protein